ncbi:hypothetical protein [Paenibacillus sp. NFR01]|uniref:hypothetical protein n=1 Tax=Paenibacillus sp. NFR01 TaxID=1566279 RepID=UPI0008B0B324|nr:hypothetical protein [Paenibacillus sp. NFR01]SET61760.1 hypothetical protein SAMN03159358_2198 [Paenibacillus sp. NFR01]
MSKKSKVIILSFLAVLLTSSLLYSTFRSQSAYAYTGGLLNGKTMLMSPAGTLTGGNTAPNATDNNTSTAVAFSAGYNVYYKFPTDQTISQYQIYASKDAGTLRFYDSSNNLLKAIVSPVSTNTLTTLDSPISNVRYIEFANTTASVYSLYEIDVFSQSTSPTVTPSATPVPTPTATPVPTPTATPVPTATPEPSPSATPEIPSGDRAILTIKLTSGEDKEFDLPMTEVNAFMTWYDSATGTARYGIDKHYNNKGPFSKRTEYVIHDKILNFEVSEYNVTE